MFGARSRLAGRRTDRSPHLGLDDPRSLRIVAGPTDPSDGNRRGFGRSCLLAIGVPVGKFYVRMSHGTLLSVEPAMLFAADLVLASSHAGPVATMVAGATSAQLHGTAFGSFKLLTASPCSLPARARGCFGMAWAAPATFIAGAVFCAFTLLGLRLAQFRSSPGDGPTFAKGLGASRNSRSATAGRGAPRQGLDSGVPANTGGNVGMGNARPPNSNACMRARSSTVGHPASFGTDATSGRCGWADGVAAQSTCPCASKRTRL